MIIKQEVPPEAESWLNMSILDFPGIINASNMLPEWYAWPPVNKDIAGIVPVNKYIKSYSSYPKISSIGTDYIEIDQFTYADIFIRQISDLEIYAVDRVWQRQFYPSLNKYNIDKSKVIADRCFKTFISWVPNIECEYNVYSKENDSSFLVIPKTGKFTNSTINNIYNTPLIDFYFTKSKKHMLAEDYGVIEKDSYMFSIKIFADSKDIKKMVKSCEKK